MAMYEKNLKEDLRLRLSKDDMDFLRGLSEKRAVSVSEVIRSIIGEYRRSLDMVNVLADAMKKYGEGGLAVHGDTETDKHNLV